MQTNEPQWAEQQFLLQFKVWNIKEKMLKALWCEGVFSECVILSVEASLHIVCPRTYSYAYVAALLIFCGA